MKKILAMLLVAVMCFAFVACDSIDSFTQQATIAAMKNELNDFSKYVQLNLITYNNNWEISSGVFVSQDANGNFTVSTGTIADAFNSCEGYKTKFSGTFVMDGDTLVYTNEDGTISVAWDEAVNKK